MLSLSKSLGRCADSCRVDGLDCLEQVCQYHHFGVGGGEGVRVCDQDVWLLFLGNKLRK